MAYTQAEVDVINRALSQAETRTNVTLAEMAALNTNESIQADILYAKTRDELIRRAPWNSVRNYANLQLITATPGTPENPGNPVVVQWTKSYPPPPWAYEYALPTDCLRVLFVVPQFATGFAGAVPITTALQGWIPSFWNGPPVRFSEGVDQPITATAISAITNGGAGYAVGDWIFVAGGTTSNAINPNVSTIIYVSGVAGGVITSAIIYMGGTYGTAPGNPVAQALTTGSGIGAQFNLTYSTAVDQKVLWTNQEYTIIAYNRRVTDPTIWDSLLDRAIVNWLGARLGKALTGNTQQIQLNLSQANDALLQARAVDANEGLTINDVTPSWIRVRGINFGYDNSQSPSMIADWGPQLTLY